MNNGEWTATVARALSKRFQSRAEILFDHGNRLTDGADRVGVISAWFSDTRKRDALLADLDIAVLLPRSNRVLLLIEIEEGTASPKTLLGDVFAALIAEHFTFQGKRDLEMGDWTRLVVLSRADTHRPRIDLLANRLAHYKSMCIGRVIVETFSDQAELEAKLTRHIETALVHHSEF